MLYSLQRRTTSRIRQLEEEMEATVTLLTLAEAAEQLRKSEAQLRWMIHKKAAPKSAIIGGRRMFRASDVAAWIEAQFERESA